MFNKVFPKIVPFLRQCRKNIVEPERPRIKIRRRVARWVSKATRARALAHTHAPEHPRAHTHKYVILTAFPRQQWFPERA